MLAVESKSSAVGSSPGLRLPLAPRLAGDTAKVLEALMDADLEAAKGG